jgi:hypothetical protein
VVDDKTGADQTAVPTGRLTWSSPFTVGGTVGGLWHHSNCLSGMDIIMTTGYNHLVEPGEHTHRSYPLLYSPPRQRPLATATA